MKERRNIQSAQRLFHTIRHLRVRQIVFQLWFRLYRGSMPTVPQFGLRQRDPVTQWIEKPACCATKNTFTFLNERRAYPSGVKWEDPDASKLWLYNLHYFDYLNTANTRLSGKQEVVPKDEQCEATVLINDWITNNAPIAGNAWEPYPTSLRLVNWIKWHTLGEGLSTEALNSLAQQSAWLSSRLEYHILANHLFANAKAMVFAGLFFSGERADAWLAKGIRLVNSELAEQILPDGAHFELSPMYHAILLEDVLDMINLAKATPNTIPDAVLDSWAQCAAHMLGWQRTMLHPDGDIAFFNDAAFDIARTPTQLENYAAQLDVAEANSALDLKPHSALLETSGFAVITKGPFTVIADVALVGPSYQPGHAHADTLSCECSVGLDRLLVNAGTSTYATGELRDWQRSTAAHNTVEIAGLNSTDVWGGFRVARRAYPHDVSWHEEAAHSLLKASHDGYRFLRGQLSHSRQWHVSEEALCVTDVIESHSDNKDSRQHSVVARWLLHPEVQVTGPQTLRILSGQQLVWTVSNGDAEMVPAYWYPRFGMQQATHCIVVTAVAGKAFSINFSLVGTDL